MESRHHEEERERTEERKIWKEKRKKEKRDLHLTFDEFFE
jgi:hypothetical protein